MNNLETITIKTMLAWLDSGEKFDMIFVTCDQRKHTGGERITVHGAIKTEWLSKEECKAQQQLHPVSKRLKKDPNHFENGTRNILLNNGQVIKIHIALVRQFNGKKIL